MRMKKMQMMRVMRKAAKRTTREHFALRFHLRCRHPKRILGQQDRQTSLLTFGLLHLKLLGRVGTHGARWGTFARWKNRSAHPV